jgi:hypothetical protein
MSDESLLAIYRTIYKPPREVLMTHGPLKYDRTKTKEGDVIFRENWAYNLYRITDYFIFPQRMRCGFENHGSPYDKYATMLMYDLKPSAHARDIILKMQKEQNCSLLHFNRIILLYRELLKDNLDIKVIDSSAGWGDRIIASMLYGVSEYVAYDPNTKLIEGHKEMMQYFNDNKLFGFYSSKKKESFVKYKIHYKNFENSYAHEFKYLNHFDICVSSPPFFAKEIYSLDKTQSAVSYPDIMDWLNNFLIASFIKVMTFLKSGGYLCWYIEDMRDNAGDYVSLFLEKIALLNICKKIHKIGFDYHKNTTKHYESNVRYFHIWQKL